MGGALDGTECWTDVSKVVMYQNDGILIVSTIELVPRLGLSAMHK